VASGYDDSMTEYAEFMASRSNYDIAEGIDIEGHRRYCVLEIIVAGRRRQQRRDRGDR